MNNSEEIKRKLTEMFSWFHNFCINNNLRYYAIGGTMLGAVRHKGFIPWDDDIDVGMPRSDYKRLEQLLNGESHERYILETPNTSANDYFYAFSKLYDSTTTLIENTKVHIKRGIYLDIFPLDGLADTEEECVENYKVISRTSNLLLARVAGIRKGRSLYKNIAVICARLIPSFLMSNKRLLQAVVDCCCVRDFDKCKWGGNLVGAWGFKEIMQVDLFGKPKLYTFEGLTVYGVSEADAYLRCLYGDWQQLPPAEKQVTHHDFILCDLHKSYLE